MLRFLLGIGAPLIKMLGVTALQEAMDALRQQFDRIETEQASFRARLDAVEKRNDAVFHGWELMEKARAVTPHAAAAEARLAGETLQEYAHRTMRHANPKPRPKAANVDGDGDEPPEDHV